MNIEWTNGMIILVSGISGCVISILLFFVLAKVFKRKGKKLISKIEKEYE